MEFQFKRILLKAELPKFSSSLVWLFGIILLCSPVIGNAQTTAENQIRSLMDQQTRCWNEGNLECFMETYWRSDSLKFIGNMVTYGWQNTLDNYRKAYPTRLAMGELTFKLISMEPIGKEHYFVVGQYVLHYKDVDRTGHFSLVFKKIDGSWRIIADHSS